MSNAEISKKSLLNSAHAAAKKAIARTIKENGAITYQIGKRIIKEYSDGREETIKTFDKAYIKPIKKRYKLV